MTDHTILAGDVGGTKTTLALYDRAGNLLQEATYHNREFRGLEEVVVHFVADQAAHPVRGCFGIAGPVRNNRVAMTNLDWTIDGANLARTIDADQVLLVNDLVATAAGAVTLPPEDLLTLNAGSGEPDGAIGVLAPGTGLGESFVLSLQGSRHAFPTEGGHCSFAPRNDEQVQLLQFLRQEYDHVSVEQVCSGRAIPDLYRFAARNSQAVSWLEEQLAAADDRSPVIVAAALEARQGGRPCEPAVHTLELFVDILAAEAANLCLKVLTTGAIYIGGGIPPRILDFFDRDRFMQVFCRGIYRDMLATIPIHIIRNPKTALLGAREIAMAGV